MAGVSKQFLEAYKPLSTKKLKDPIIFVVGVIEDFVYEGALHDKEINAATMHTEALIYDTGRRVIFIANPHPPKTREFDSYPPHCVIGTKESEVIQELQLCVRELIHKNSTSTFACLDFQSFLTEYTDSYCDIVITGCYTSICVLQFALHLGARPNKHSEADQRIIIPPSYMGTYHVEGMRNAIFCSEFSIRNMEASGIYTVSSLKRGD